MEYLRKGVDVRALRGGYESRGGTATDGQDLHGVYGNENKGEGVSVSDNGRVIAMTSLKRQDYTYVGRGQCLGWGI